MSEGSSAKAAGRGVGLVYLILIVFSSGGYATMSWLIGGDLHMVLARLAARHAVFILAFAAMLIGFVAWVTLAFMLYGLMSSSGRLLGLLMLTFTVAGAAMNLVAMSHLFRSLARRFSTWMRGRLHQSAKVQSRASPGATILGPLAASARPPLAYRAAASGLVPLHWRLWLPGGFRDRLRPES
jgi:hypothetical protein